MASLNRILFKHLGASCVLHPNKGYFILFNLYSLEPGKGHAKELMQQVVDWADKEHVKIVLEPRLYGNPRGIPTEGLKVFYARFGFQTVISTPVAIMEREPKENN